MYRMIAEDLRAQIETGQLRPGAQLPTEVELRERYDASRNTIRDAIKLLSSLGLVETRPGQGTFITRKIDPLINTIKMYPADEGAGYMAEVASRGRQASLSAPQVEIQIAPDWLIHELRVEDRTPVISRYQRRFIDGTPWSMHTAFYPQELVARGAERLVEPGDIPLGALAYLNEKLGIRMETWRVRLLARKASDYEVQFFELHADSVAVVEVYQTYYDQSEAPFCVTVTTCPADRNLFRIAAGQVPSIYELSLE